VATDFEVRAWAAAHGYDLSDDADVPASLRAAYAEAQTGTPDSNEWETVESALAKTRRSRNTAPTTSSWSETQNLWEDPQPVRPGSLDRYSLAALIFGIVPLVGGLLGIVFGAIGISRTKRHRQRGRLMAVAGVLLGCIWLVATLVAVAFVVGVSHRDIAGTVTPTDQVSIASLHLGDCLDHYQPTSVSTFKVTACRAPHDAQVYGVIALTNSENPEDAQTRRLADAGCQSRLAPAVGIAIANNQAYGHRALLPTDQSWRHGGRIVDCVIYSVSGRPLTGAGVLIN
jgi:hypothetical protein